jgi:hypothetical protein
LKSIDYDTYKKSKEEESRNSDNKIAFIANRLELFVLQLEEMIHDESKHLTRLKIGMESFIDDCRGNNDN